MKTLMKLVYAAFAVTTLAITARAQSDVFVSRNKISGHVIRSAAYAVSLLFAFIALSSALNSPNRSQKSGWAIRARETTRRLPNGVRKVKMPVVFTVTNTNDTGAGSLRQAILDSNASPPPPPGTSNLIVFNISGSGVHTIMPATQLPDILQPLEIDGYTQPGSSPNTNPPGQGDNAVILIELSGAIAPPGSTGLTIDADECGVRGLAINQFQADAIDIGSNVLANDGAIEGNFIGTNATGTAALPNGASGVVFVQGNNYMIGGMTPAARNVISGNIGDGVALLAPASVQGNFIGTDVTGRVAIGNGQRGVSSRGLSLIGGNVAALGNIISGNNRGIECSSDVVQGNFIGTDLTGTIAVPNLNVGVNVNGTATIGGLTSTPGAAPGNLISGNGIAGLVMPGVTSSETTVQGNIIGADVTGTQALGNAAGISIVDASFCTVGGTVAGAGNIVAFNGTLCDVHHAGIIVSGSDAIRNSIEGNSIFSNGGLGIDLFVVFDGPCGITDNDECDTDIGPNNLQNYPVLTSVTSGGGITTILGTLNSAPNTTFRIEFFDNHQCHPSGNGSGETFIGSTDVMTDGNCNAPISVTFQVNVEAGHVITATATDNGNTSEFSACVPVNGGGPTPTGTPSPTPTGTPSPTPTGTPVCNQSITSGNAIWYLDRAGSYQITVSGGNPNSYNAAQLPPGLTVNTNTGVISGRPTTVNTYFPILSATFGTCTVFKNVTFTVNPRFTPAPRPTPPPHITPAATPRFTPVRRPTPPPHLTPVPSPTSPRPTPAPRPQNTPTPTPANTPSPTPTPSATAI
jgi:hypothetical protein